MGYLLSRVEFAYHKKLLVVYVGHDIMHRA